METTEKKNTLEAPRGPSLYKLDPRKVVIGGLDRPVAATDPVYDERASLSDEEAMIAEFAANMIASREDVTIEVTPRENEAWALKGRRRTRAARIAWDHFEKLGETPPKFYGIVRRGDAATLATASLVENFQRLDDPPMVLAEKFARLMETYGWDHSKLADLCSLTVQSVKNTLSLLKLAEPARAALERGTIGPTVGYELARIPQGDQAQALEIALSRGGSVKDVKLAISNLRALPSGEEVETVEAEAVDGEIIDIDAETVAAGGIPTKIKLKAKPKAEAPPATKYEPPTPGQWKRLLTRMREEGAAVGEGDLDDLVVTMMRVIIGELSVKRVPGLSQAFRALGVNLGQSRAD